MKKRTVIAIAACALACASASSARAQEERQPTYSRQRVRAPRQAFEIGVSTGYTQGLGKLRGGPGNNVGDVADAGLGIGLNLGYRANPNVSIGVHNQYQELKADNGLTNGTNVRGLVTGIEGSYHFMPYTRLDPWLSVGTGYRLMWEVPPGSNNNLLRHGFEIAKAQVGFDMRVSPDVAIAPTLGADLNMFVWENPEGSRGNQEIHDKRVNTFLYAGIQGRFDLGGVREPMPARVTAIGRRY